MIIQAKLKRPNVSGDKLCLDHVAEKIKQGLQRKLVLVAAPAGFGKTALVASFLDALGDSSGVASAWLTLDSEDNVPQFFMSHLLHALAGLNHQSKASLANLLELPGSFAEPENNLKPLFGKVLNILLENEPESEQAPERILVVDNFHLLAQPHILSAFNFFLDYLPNNYHIFLISRTIPAIHFEKRKLSNELFDLHAKDLQLSNEQVKQLLSEQLGFPLKANDAENLLKKMQGWPVAVQWVVRGLQSGQSIEQLISDDSDTLGFSEYVISEVISSLSPEVRTFLSFTAHLPQFNSALCEEVLGQKKSLETIRFLEKENLFLIGLGEEIGWYSYQELFRQAILALDEDEPFLAATLQKAILWYEKKGYFALALSLALSMGTSKNLEHQETSSIKSLLENDGLALIHEGHMMLVKDALERLGGLRVKESSKLTILQVRVWLTMAMAHIKPIEEYIEISNHIITTAPSALDWHQEFDYIQGYMARLRGDLSGAVRLTKSVGVEEDLSPQSELALAMNDYMLGHLRDASIKASRALALAYESGHVEMVESCAIRLAWVLQWQGQYGQAKTIYHQSRSWLHERKQLTQSFIAWQNLMLSAIHREFDELPSARECMNAVLAAKDSDPKLSLFAPFSNAKLFVSERKLDQAAYELDKVEMQYLPMQKSIQGFPSIEAERMKIALLQAHWDEASRWLSSKETKLLSNKSYRFEEERITLARVYLLLDNPLVGTESLLKDIIGCAETGGRVNASLVAKLLLAVTLFRQNKTIEAIELFDQVLGRASAVGYVRLFLDEPVPLVDLMQKMLNENRHLETLSYLMQSLAPGIEAQVVSSLVEPLSRRELDVLGLLDKGLANKEIGEQLFIGVGTVKTHVRNILSKLSATNRTQAVAEARNLGLLA